MFCNSSSTSGTSLSYNPDCPKTIGLGSSLFARRYLGNTGIFYPADQMTRQSKRFAYWFIFLWVLRCFTSPGTLLEHPFKISLKSEGFPHSDTSGSKVAHHLPEAFRRLPRPSSPFQSQGIHHTPFRLPEGSLKTTILVSISVFLVV